METYTKEVAIFGGTFDPPTRAHEAIVQACLDQSHIDEVWLMPSGQRTDKPGMTHVDTRLAMLELVITATFGDNPRLKICNLEMVMPQPTHTAQTHEALQQVYPDIHFWFVFGADSYHDMPNWEYGEELRREMAILVMDRTGFELPTETDGLRHLPILDLEHPISSTLVRQHAQTGNDVEPFVNQAVSDFIRQTALYTQNTLQ